MLCMASRIAFEKRPGCSVRCPCMWACLCVCVCACDWCGDCHQFSSVVLTQGMTCGTMNLSAGGCLCLRLWMSWVCVKTHDNSVLCVCVCVCVCDCECVKSSVSLYGCELIEQ